MFFARMGVGKRVCRRNSNFNVIICCSVETLIVRYYLGVCECMLAHTNVCVCVCWGGGRKRERESRNTAIINCIN